MRFDESLRTKDTYVRCLIFACTSSQFFEFYPLKNVLICYTCNCFSFCCSVFIKTNYNRKTNTRSRNLEIIEYKKWKIKSRKSRCSKLNDNRSGPYVTNLLVLKSEIYLDIFFRLKSTCDLIQIQVCKQTHFNLSHALRNCLCSKVRWHIFLSYLIASLLYFLSS